MRRQGDLAVWGGGRFEGGVLDWGAGFLGWLAFLAGERPGSWCEFLFRWFGWDAGWFAGVVGCFCWVARRGALCCAALRYGVIDGVCIALQCGAAG